MEEKYDLKTGAEGFGEEGEESDDETGLEEESGEEGAEEI
jgi:hypothetical protein